MEDIPVGLSTTGSLVGCPDEDHLAQTHGAPCNRGTVGMGDVDGLEDYLESGVAGAILPCTEVDQLTPVHEVHGIDSFANTTVRAIRGEIGQERRRKLPKFYGTYVDGSLNGLEVTYAVDGAATDTLIVPWIYEQLPEDVRPKLQPDTTSRTSGAGGGQIQILGKANFEIQLGPIKLVREARVAEIKGEILLGDDIIQRDPEGPMDIINSREVIIFKGHKIPLLTVGHLKRVVAVNRCIVTPVVIRATGQVTVQVHLFNPFAEPTLLKGEQVLGELVPVNVEQILKEEEHSEERENLSCMRQVQVWRRSTRLIKRLIRQARQEKKGLTLQGDGSAMPKHLWDLFERLSEGWTVGEQDTIRRLLMQYQDVFSKNEFDLG